MAHIDCVSYRAICAFSFRPARHWRKRQRPASTRVAQGRPATTTRLDRADDGVLKPCCPVATEPMFANIDAVPQRMTFGRLATSANYGFRGSPQTIPTEVYHETIRVI
jgi:hypothetical protein